MEVEEPLVDELRQEVEMLSSLCPSGDRSGGGCAAGRCEGRRREARGPPCQSQTSSAALSSWGRSSGSSLSAAVLCLAWDGFFKFCQFE